MNIKTQLYNNYKKEKLYPVTLLGVYLDFEELCFLMDELEEKYKNDIKLEKDDYIFYKLVEKFNCNKDLTILLGDECGFISNDECYVGIPLRGLNENFSITRMKIDLYNDLLKLEILSHNDDINQIHIFTDVMIDEKKEEVKDGSVQKNTKE